MRVREIYRLCQIIRLLLRYGLDDLLPRIPKVVRGLCRLLFGVRQEFKNEPISVRARLALQELGPIWIKLGQMLSTRGDLLPAEVVDQLTQLQDRVAPFTDPIEPYLEKMLGGPLENWFEEFNPQPIAAASIAQVYTARLVGKGCEVILKVNRPNLRQLINTDIQLIYLFARLIERWYPGGHRLRLVELVRECETTLLDELNLLREAANMIQFRRNFAESPLLYVPEVHLDLCRKTLLVMERIRGVPISDVATLKDKGTSMKVLAERGVQLFFTQVFRHSLFHADMHPGNIFVNVEKPSYPQYIAVDYGVVGTLCREDKHYLAANFIAFFNRDYRQVAQLHLDSGWVAPDTNVDRFEFALRTICEPIFQKPLAEIPVGQLFLDLLKTAHRFNMTVQPQLMLLQKTLLYVESLGKQLYPQLDLWITAKPFLESWMREQSGWRGLWRALKERSPGWLDRLPEIPDLWYNNWRRQQGLEEKLTALLVIQEQRAKRRRVWRKILGSVLLLLLTAVIFTVRGMG